MFDKIETGYLLSLKANCRIVYGAFVPTFSNYYYTMLNDATLHGFVYYQNNSEEKEIASNLYIFLSRAKMTVQLMTVAGQIITVALTSVPTYKGFAVHSYSLWMSMSDKYIIAWAQKVPQGIVLTESAFDIFVHQKYDKI